MCKDAVTGDLHIELLQAEEAVQAASRAKSEFLANTSHQIRTTVNNIIGITDAVLGTELTPEQQVDLNIVKDSAQSLLKVMDDILTFFQIAER
ncbi:MAG TPA: histidine kinase dimerization/phospho-acceptor domain-containing protein [Bryobacteraceae bacterium]|nr:histidine kinase dimerization/phospho-acceptor domain-containing protein [Bryobacteraceae bacterium]